MRAGWVVRHRWLSRTVETRYGIVPCQCSWWIRSGMLLAPQITGKLLAMRAAERALEKGEK